MSTVRSARPVSVANVTVYGPKGAASRHTRGLLAALMTARRLGQQRHKPRAPVSACRALGGCSVPAEDRVGGATRARAEYDSGSYPVVSAT